MQQNSMSSKAGLWTGRILKAMITSFLLFDACMKIIRHPIYVQGTEELGLPGSSVQTLGIYLLLSSILYIVPGTAVLGCLFITAYLGGAAAVTYAMDDSGFAYLFPVGFTLLVWIAEYLRNQKIRTTFPLIK